MHADSGGVNGLFADGRCEARPASEAIAHDSRRPLPTEAGDESIGHKKTAARGGRFSKHATSDQ
jgi:prepilin-type processing-associated H-X9-DG protein